MSGGEGKKRIIEVAAGVIRDRQQRILLGQRAEGSFYPGYWEFPGGKVEPGETPAEALIRELQEELGIVVDRLDPWLVREHHYEHGHVRLHFFEVPQWHGVLADRVHAALSWQSGEAPEVSPMLPANAPVFKALQLPRFMAITDCGHSGMPHDEVQMRAALAAGASMVQVREPDMLPEQRAALCKHVGEVFRASGCAPLIVVNQAASEALPDDAQGLHLSGARLMSLAQRPGHVPWLGASCHSREELEQAARIGVDYALLGPVKPTRSHPGQLGMGWKAFRELVRELPFPVLALGGVGPADMDIARRHGAHGIAAIRGAWSPPGSDAEAVGQP